MATVDVGARESASISAANELHDLLDHHVGDIFSDVDTNVNAPMQRTSPVKTGEQANTAGLGIDEEIKVTKKRTPVPRLNEDRYIRVELK